MFVVLIQLGGMVYAYHAQMKEAEQSLNKCFWMSFSETVDNVVNNLPLPDWTIIHITYAPSRLKLNQNEYNKLGSEQVACALQRVYGVKGIPLVNMDSILHKKLERVYIKGKITIERFNVNTGEVLESTNPDVHPNFTTITSEKAFVYKERGEAVRAIVAFPFGEMMRNVLILLGITFLLLAVAVYALIVQMRSLISQQHSLRQQQQDFYTLAEDMSVPVTEILKEIPHQTWKGIEEKSSVLFGMTENTLSKAKSEAEQTQQRRQFPFKVVAMVSLIGIFLLLGIWSVYLYHIGSKKMTLQVEDHFEEAFYNETFYHRYILFAQIHQDLIDEFSIKGEATPYAKRLFKGIRDLYKEKGYHIRMNYTFVYHIYNKFDENQRMHAAYTMQDTINRNTIIPIPFSLQYADSAFASELVKGKFQNRSDIRWIKYPSKELLLYTGDPVIKAGDLSTKLIPLDADSTSCIQGILRAPQGKIATSIWYMLLPLGITFIFICLCVYLQIRMLRTQRRLKQFQKDFTYSMIHDMKSPLSSVMMSANILATGKLDDKPEKKQKYEQVMKDECEHLLALSGKVVMLTQIDRGELELHKEEVILEPLIKDITDKFLLRAAKKIQFTMKCEEGVSVYADAFCLREVLSNLIDNAIKYSRSEVEITLSCSESDGYTVLKVHDTGIGIPMKEQRKIFDKFERVSAGNRKSDVSGFGLGLNYVLQVMEAHEGKVNVESVEGSYSVFSISFPIIGGMK